MAFSQLNFIHPEGLFMQAAAARSTVRTVSEQPHVSPYSGQEVGAGRGAMQLVGVGSSREQKRVGVSDFLFRVLEVIFAGTVLLATAPLMVVIACIIRLDSRGPALFRQWRLGKDAKPFRFYKFRTMFVDARERYPELYAYRYSAQDLKELCFKVPEDPRVTRVGRWLRKSTLDELPNFINVVIGNMALVGPRPEIPEMLCYYAEDEVSKFDVRPGVTGLAQTSGRGRLSFLETKRLDAEYVRARSVKEDIRILLRTVRMVLARDGAF
jgi:lipopolysaccharide/colanic/teichoic acid biosynthesis glycosyltransferase